MAKTHLKNNKIPFKEINLDVDPHARNFLAEKGHRSVPQIYHEDELFIEGGAEELIKLNKLEIQELMGILGLDDLSL